MSGKNGYLYFDPVTAAMIAISTVPNAEYAALYPFVEIPLDELEMLANEEPKSNEPGYVFFNGQWGGIRGVSLNPEPDMMARYDHIRVPREHVMKFMSDEWHVEEWEIGYTTTNRTEPRLIKKGTPRLIRLSMIDTEWTELPDHKPPVPVTLCVRAARQEGSILVFLDRPEGDMEIETEVDKMRFMITRRGDPSQVFDWIEIDVKELVEKGSLIIPVNADLTSDVTVYTKRLFEGSYQEFVQYHNMIQLPKGHFSDMDRFRTDLGDERPSVIATIDRKRGIIRLDFQEKVAKLYDRESPDVPLVLTVPNDPTFILWGTKLHLPQLFEKGKVELAIPDRLKDQPFDIVTPLIVRNMLVREG